MTLSFFRTSIARRVAMTLLLACALVWIVVYLVGRAGVMKAVTGSFDREMHATAAAARQLAERSRTPRDLGLRLAGLCAAIQAQIATQDSPSGFLAFRVRDATAEAAPYLCGNMHRWPEPSIDEGMFFHESNGQRYRMYRSLSRDGHFSIEVSQALASRQQVFDEVMFSYEGLQPLLFGLPLLLIPVWLAVHTGLSPLRRLSSELASRHPADLTPIRVPPVYRELTPVVREFNATLARLAALLSRERAFLADAAHELRTPLAVISAQCDTLQLAPPGQEHDAALRRLHGGLLRARRLVNQLLALARLEADIEDHPVVTDIADIARDCLAAHAISAGEKAMELSYSGPDSLIRRCPGQALESIFDNLVGNALRYGRRDGQVELFVAVSDNDEVHVRVSDDGPGIADAELPHIYERFRRGANAQTSGSGLGLAIVKSAARQLGARIEILPGLGGRGVAFDLKWRP